MGFPEAAFLVKACVVEVVLLDAEAGCDVVANEVEPRKLVGGGLERRLEGQSAIPLASTKAVFELLKLQPMD